MNVVMLKIDKLSVFNFLHQNRYFFGKIFPKLQQITCLLIFYIKTERFFGKNFSEIATNYLLF